MSREGLPREQTGLNGFAGVGLCIANDWEHSSRDMAGCLPSCTGRNPVSTAQGGHCSSTYCQTFTLSSTLGCRQRVPDASPLCCAALTGRTPSHYMPWRTPGISTRLHSARLHQAHPRYLCQLQWLGALPVLHASRTPGYTSGRAHSRHKPAQLHVISRLSAHPDLRWQQKRSRCQHQGVST